MYKTLTGLKFLKIIPNFKANNNCILINFNVYFYIQLLLPKIKSTF